MYCKHTRASRKHLRDYREREEFTPFIPTHFHYYTLYSVLRTNNSEIVYVCGVYFVYDYKTHYLNLWAIINVMAHGTYTRLQDTCVDVR